MPFATEGRWTGVTQTPGDSATIGDGLGVFVVHATLLHTGEVLWFSGHVETSHYLTESYVWDPTQAVGTAVKQPFPAGTDVFCCHHANLDDGRVITVGGAASTHGRGITAICVFDPGARAWTKIGDMQHGRWYPTLVTLPDGRLVVFAGRTEPGGSPFLNPAVELLSPPFSGPGYASVVLAGANKTFPTYPGLHLVPGGRIVHTGTTWQYEDTASTPIGTFSFRMTGPTDGAWTDEGVFPVVRQREQGTSVLLAPAQDGRILLLGGSDAEFSGGTFVGQAAGVQPRSAEILDTRTTPPTWTRIGDMTHPRINVNAVLLPDGRVLVIGGHNNCKFDPATIPSNQSEIYDPVLNTWTLGATMGAPRMYHSAALLLPDGRVVVAGGFDPNGPGDGNRKSFEFYEPPYFFNPDDTVAVRSTITSVAGVDVPGGQVAYGGQLVITTPDAANIRKVVLMRPGAATHHTDSEQRSVALDFFEGPAAGQLTALVPNDPSVAPPGFYMLWIVDANNRPCQRATFVRLMRSNCFVIVDKSQYSNAEVQAAPASTDFDSAFYVVMDGFLPSDLGITSATATTPPPAATAPSIVVRRANGTVVGEITAQVQELLYELPALPAGVRQRFTFRYRLRFTGPAPFFEADGVTAIEMQNLTLEATLAGFTGRGGIRLHHQPNPFMLDGDTPWLSIDLQVFNVRAGDTRFGQPSHGSTDDSAVDFIRGVLSRFNGNATTGASEFASIAAASSTTTLDWSYTRAGTRTFNYAIAKVRYRGLALSANNVRVFFRLFTVAATGTEFRAATTYKTVANAATGAPIPALGLVGSEIGTIPFFATRRVNTSFQRLSDQDDPPNVLTLAPTGGAESATYFGCWLDFNNTVARYPWHPGNAIGPFASGLQSIATLINGRHQCLVAEVHFNPSIANPLVIEGDSPGSSDKLSQRNLAIVYSTNPGTDPTRTVMHPFEMAARRSTFTGLLAMQSLLERGRTTEFVPSGPDELMIIWNSLPRTTVAELFLPQLDAAEVVRLAALRIGPDRVELLDGHTIRCHVGDVSYLPLPDFGPEPLAGLVTLRLPLGVKYDQVFRVVFQQITAARRVVGQFELRVRVMKAESIVDEDVNTLAVIRHVATARPSTDRWKPVLLRYADQFAERVRGLGVNPDLVEPSPLGSDGSPGLKDPKTDATCRLFSWLTLVLAAAAPPVAGTLLGTTAAAWAWLLPLALLVVLYFWQRSCAPSLCTSLRPLVIGFAIGAALLVLLGGPLAGQRLVVLAATLVLIAGLILIGLARGCGGQAKPAP